ncbi:MAG: gamma-glutamyltransferase, partial [SAR202 cluster bacterium]|nr:gamma-glutamyltransferase [SAR202 cluster bacterium]
MDILKKGGNAVDAAAAVSLALGVVAPAFSGIGGGGFMLIHIARTGENHIIDYRECAPGLATPAMFRVDDKEEVIDDENFIG